MDAAELLSDEPDARRGLCCAARAILHADVASLWQPRRDGYVEVIASTSVPRSAGGLLLPVDAADSAVARALRHGRLVLALDGPDTRLGLEASVAQPMLRMGTAVAVILAGWRMPHDELRPESLEQLALLAAAGAATLQALQRAARLERLALTDPLTRLPNRRHLELHLERELARAARRGAPLAVAVLDLDGLKQVNDSRGHDAGDAVLRETTTAWRTHLRAGDLLARVGGDEFVLVLPDCGDEAACQETVERVRLAGAASSAGVAVWQPAEDARSLLSRADEALYTAKRDGGHRTLIAA